MVQWWDRSPPTNAARVRFWPFTMHMWVVFVLLLDLLLGVSSGFTGFPRLTKTNISGFQFDQDRGPTWKPAKAGVSSLNIVIYFYFYLWANPYVQYITDQPKITHERILATLYEFNVVPLSIRCHFFLCHQIMNWMLQEWQSSVSVYPPSLVLVSRGMAWTENSSLKRCCPLRRNPAPLG